MSNIWTALIIETLLCQRQLKAESFQSFPLTTKLDESFDEALWFAVNIWILMKPLSISLSFSLRLFQDRNMDMRSLEHCLNDITNTAGVQSDLKGELSSSMFVFNYYFKQKIKL